MAVKPNLTFWDYLSAAFNATPNVPVLGPIPVNKLLVFGTLLLGFVNEGFWFAGSALEMGYLWFLSTDIRFQKLIQSQQLQIVEKTESQKTAELIRRLDKESNRRLEALNANLAEINSLMDMSADSPVAFVKETKQTELGKMPVIFLKLLVTRRLTCDSLERTDVDKLKGEIKDLTRQLESPEIGEALGKSVRSTIEIQQKRLDNIRRAQENLRLVEMELNRIEQQLQLIREEIALDRSPEALSAGIDRISATLTETEQFMSSHSEFFTRLNTEGEAPVAPVPPPQMERE